MEMSLILCPKILSEVLLSLGVASLLDSTKSEPVKKIRIGLNAGHAGTTGASGKNKAIQEHIENAAQRDRVKEILENSGNFRCVNIDQTQFGGDLLATGKAFAGCRVGISFHNNAADREEHGSESLFADTPESKALGLRLSAAISKRLGIKDRGLNSRKVSIITGAQQAGCPCFVLVESQFIDDETDPEECRVEMLKAAEAIAQVIKEHFA